MALNHDDDYEGWTRRLRAAALACLTAATAVTVTAAAATATGATATTVATATAAKANTVAAAAADRAEVLARRHHHPLRGARGLTPRALEAAPARGTAPAPFGDAAPLSSPQDAIGAPRAKGEPSVVWADLFGTAEFTGVTAVAVQGSDVYALGVTAGALEGQTSAGGLDVFLRKYDGRGRLLWTRQFGTEGDDFSSSTIAVLGGAVYVAGSVSAALPGQTSAGGDDAFLRKYDRNGNELWTRQFGTDAEEPILPVEHVHEVASSGDRVYVGGEMGAALPGQTYAGGLSDSFVRAYDTKGRELWTRQFGTEGFDRAFALAATGHGIYIGGTTDGTLPGQSSAGIFDAFLSRYDRKGRLKWTRQFGTEGFDSISAIAADAGAVYVHGETEGALPGQTNAGLLDPFVRKYGTGGSESWTRQYGTEGWENTGGIALRAGTVYLASLPEHTLDGEGGGETDALLTAYSASGSRRFTVPFGTEGYDAAFGVAVSPDGRIVVGGYAEGPLFDKEFSGGFGDGFVVQLRR